MPPPSNPDKAIEVSKFVEEWNQMSMNALIGHLSMVAQVPPPPPPITWAGKRNHGEEPMSAGVLCDVELIEGMFEKRAQSSITAPINISPNARPNFYKMLWTVMVLHKDSPFNKRRKVETGETALAQNINSAGRAAVPSIPAIQPVSLIVSWLHQTAFNDAEAKDLENMLDRTEELLPHFPIPPSIRSGFVSVAREINTTMFTRYMGTLSPARLHRSLDGQVSFMRWWAATTPENMFRYKKMWKKGDELSKNLKDELKMALGLREDDALNSALSAGLEHISQLRRRVTSIVQDEFERLLQEERERLQEANKNVTVMERKGISNLEQHMVKPRLDHDGILRRDLLSRRASMAYEEANFNDWDEIY
jgi:hypothetical protein